MSAEEHRADRDDRPAGPIDDSVTYGCGSSAVGHDPHWIQVLRVAPRGTPVAVRDVRLVDLVTVELDVDRIDRSGIETLVRRNHDAIQVYASWLSCPEGVLVHGASLLKVGPAEGERANFSVTDGYLGRCRTAQEVAR